MTRTRTRTRRQFLANAGKGLAVAGFPAIVPSSVLGAFSPGNRINVGAIGTGRISRGHDLPGIWQYDTARIMAVSEFDSRRAQDAVTLVNGYYGRQTGKPYSGVTCRRTSITTHGWVRRRSFPTPRSGSIPWRATTVRAGCAASSSAPA